MLLTCLKIFSGSLIPYIVYSNRAGKILSFYIKNDNFWNYFKKHLLKILYTNRSNTHQIAPFLKIFSEDLLNPVCTFIAF